jgi:hypothetical protein
MGTNESRAGLLADDTVLTTKRPAGSRREAARARGRDQEKLMRKRFTPATVIAMVALFVALAGSATAGTALITGAQIKDGSIGLPDLSANAKRALKGQRGPRGYQGPQGASGLTGAPGAPGARGGFDPAKLKYITGPDVSVAPGQVGSAQADCPAGTAAVSGGFFSSVGNVGFSQTFGPTFHAASVWNDTTISITVHATVVCAAS